MTVSQYALDLAGRVEAFVRETVIPYESDPRRDHHGAPTDELVKALQDHVKSTTAPYKYPRMIEFVASLPKTVSGKIRRKELRDREWERGAG